MIIKLFMGTKILSSFSNVLILLDIVLDGIANVKRTPAIVEWIPLKWMKYHIHIPAIR